jgi:hypothetical protein
MLPSDLMHQLLSFLKRDLLNSCCHMIRTFSVEAKNGDHSAIDPNTCLKAWWAFHKIPMEIPERLRMK